VHLLMQALPVTCACSTSVCWLGKHSYQKCTSITQAPTHKREWTLVSWKKKIERKRRTRNPYKSKLVNRVNLTSLFRSCIECHAQGIYL
jgi:hypothetical protein